MEPLHLYSAGHALRTGGAGEVAAALRTARSRTLQLVQDYAQALAGPRFDVPYRPTVNPPRWEWGHVAWFQEWWIARNRQRDLGTACDPDHRRPPSWLDGADALFDSSRVAHTARWEIPVPTLETVNDYLAATFDQTLAAIGELGDSPSDEALYFFRLVALHEEMHAEAGLYMARSLGIPVAESLWRDAPPRREGEVAIPAQSHAMGWQGDGFAFDNEVPAHLVAVAAFSIDASPVSWGRYMAFARAGGYEDRRWWDDAGWAWLQSVPRRAKVEALAEGRDAEAAVHLSAFEADAWCRWAGRRLPTEAEWECAATTQPGFGWGEVWEWTASSFLPFDGFQPHPYRDYSQPWFGTRRVLRGASLATGAALVHPRYRNFFEPARTDILAGFRSCAVARADDAI